MSSRRGYHVPRGNVSYQHVNQGRATYQARDNRYRSIRPPARKYVLEEPKDVPRLNANLGVPGFFPHRGRQQDEEKMTLMNVVNGYQHPCAVADEYETTLSPHASIMPLDAFAGRVDEALNHIGWQKNFFRSWSHVEPPKDIRRGRGDDSNFPKQISVSADEKQKFMEMLASENVSFQDLAQKGVPHGYKGESLLNELNQFQIPFLRATWFIKVIQLNSRKSCGNRDPEDWTETLATYLANIIKNLGTMQSTAADAANASTSKPNEKEKYYNRLAYAVQLLQWNYQEKLVNPTKLFGVFLPALQEGGHYESTVILYILSSYLQDLILDRYRLSTFVRLLLVKWKKIDGQAEEMSLLRQLLRDTMRYLLETAPDRMVFLVNVQEIHSLVCSGQDDEISNDHDSYDEILAKHLEEQNRSLRQWRRKLDGIYESDHIDAPALVSELDRTANLLNDVNHLFESFRARCHLMEPISKPTAQLKESVAVVCEWAISPKRRGIVERAAIAAGLLKRLDHHLKSQSHRSGTEWASWVSEQLQEFLRTHASGEQGFAWLLEFFSEVQLAGLFSHDQFARYLISRGALTTSREDAEHLKNLLYRLPIHGPIYQHNQRRTLLTQCSYDAFDRVQENEAIQQIKTAMEEMFTSVHGLPKGAFYQSHLQWEHLQGPMTNDEPAHLAFLLAHHPEYVSRTCTEWFLRFLTSRTEESCSLAQYHAAEMIFEHTGDRSSLVQLLLFALRHWKAAFPQVAASLQRHVNSLASRDLLQGAIDLLPLRARDCERHSELCVQVISTLLTMKVEHSIGLSFPAALKTSAQSLSSPQISTPGSHTPSGEGVPDLVGDNRSLAEVVGAWSICSMQQLSSIVLACFYRIVAQRQSTDQSVFESYTWFLWQVVASNKSSCADHERWFCKQFNEELLPLCGSSPSQQLDDLFPDTASARETLPKLLAEFVAHLISVGYLSISRFYESSLLAVLSGNISATSAPALSILARPLLLLETPWFISSPFSCQIVRESMKAAVRSVRPPLLIQLLCALFHATKSAGLDPSIVQEVSEARIIPDLVRSAPSSVIRLTLRSSEIPSANERRQVFHSIFYGSEEPFLPFDRQTAPSNGAVALQTLLEFADPWQFELARLGVEFISDDWKQQTRQDDHERVFNSVLIDKLLWRLALHPSRLDLLSSLALALGDSFQQALLERISTLFSDHSCLLGERAVVVTLLGESHFAQNAQRIEREESKILLALVRLVVALSPKATAAQQLLKNLTDQLHVWHTETSKKSFTDCTGSVDRLQSNMVQRLFAIGALSEHLHPGQNAEIVERLGLLLIDMCANPFVQFCASGERDALEVIALLLEKLLDPIVDPTSTPADRQGTQRGRELRRKFEESWRNLKISPPHKERLREALYLLDEPSHHYLTFTTLNTQIEPSQYTTYSLDPWTILEGYHEALLSPKYFAGRSVERSNLTYLKSPFERSNAGNATQDS